MANLKKQIIDLDDAADTSLLDDFYFAGQEESAVAKRFSGRDIFHRMSGAMVRNIGAADPDVAAMFAPLFAEKRNVYRRKGVRTLIGGTAKADYYNNTPNGYDNLTEISTRNTWYGGGTSVRVTCNPGDWVYLMPPVNFDPIDMSDGMLTLWYRAISNVGADSSHGLNRLRFDLFDTGSPSSPPTDYKTTPNADINPAFFKFQCSNTSGEGIWQRFGVPIGQMVDVAGGADITAITGCRIAIQSMASNIVVMEIGALEFTPNALDKAKLVFTYDDCYHIPQTVSKMASCGFRGVLYPGAFMNDLRYGQADRMEPEQLIALHDLGWQVAMQSGTSELTPDEEGWTDEEYMADQVKSIVAMRSLGLTGWEDGSYYTDVVNNYLRAHAVNRKLFRSMRTFINGNSAGAPILLGEMFPFQDPYFVRCLNVESYTGTDADDRVVAHIEQGIGNKGLIVVAAHNLPEGNANIRAGLFAGIDYANDNRDLVDVVTFQDLHRQFG